MRRARRPSPLALLAYALVAFLYAPLAVVALFAFNDGSNLSWPPQGLSLRWFGHIFGDESFRRAFGNSLRVATVTAIASALLALGAAVVLTRHRHRLVSVVEAVANLPAMLPGLLLAVGLFSAMAQFAISPSFATITLGHLILVIPVVLLVVVSRLKGFDLDLELAARDLGAGPLQTFRRITLRIVAPAVVGAALLAFASSFDEVAVSNFTAGSITTLPLYVFSRLRRSVDPSINAVATFLLVAPLVVVFVALPLVRRSLPYAAGPEEEEGG